MRYADENEKGETTSAGIYIGKDEDGDHWVYIGKKVDDTIYFPDLTAFKYITARKKGSKNNDGNIYWGSLKKNKISGFIYSETIKARHKKYNAEINKIKKLIGLEDGK